MLENLDKFRQFWTTPHRLYAASCLRVGLAVIMLLMYVVHFKERNFLWGPHGEIDWSFYKHMADPWSLYRFNGSVAWSEILYWCGTVVSILFAIGIAPRITGILFYICVRSVMNRNYMSLDGGQNLLQILAFFLMFANSGEHFVIIGRTDAPTLVRTVLKKMRPTLAIVHNGAMSLIAGQVCMLYFWSGFYKVSGHKWQDGTAIYYVMRANEFSLPGLSPFIFHSAILVTALTYATLVFQMSFPVLMWNKRVKPFLFVAAVSFHLGIAIFMGLVAFSMTMIIADLAIFSDSFFVSVAVDWQRLTARVFRGDATEGVAIN